MAEKKKNTAAERPRSRRTPIFCFIDLFAGCGGLSEGFLSTGKFQSLAHVEWEKPMVETLRNRLMTKWKFTEVEAKRDVICFDIQHTDELINGNWSKESIDRYGKYNDEMVVNGGLKAIVGKHSVDLIIGGPPCQAYWLFAPLIRDLYYSSGNIRSAVADAVDDLLEVLAAAKDLNRDSQI